MKTMNAMKMNEMFEMTEQSMEMVTGGHRAFFNGGGPRDFRIGSEKVTDSRNQFSDMTIGSEYDPSGLRIPPVGPQCW